MRKLFLVLFISSLGSAFAGGFQLNVQGVRALGLGGAFTGFCTNASSVFYNPAGLTRLTGHQVLAGVSLIFPKVSLQTPSTDNINQTSGMATPLQLYYGGQLTEKLYVGFALNNPFGSSSSFEDDWEGRFIVQNISLKTFAFQPSVAYKFSDYFSLGAGFMITTGKFSFEKAVPVSSNTNEYGKASLSGSGIGFGYNVGIYSTVLNNDKLRLNLGVDFRSGTAINLDEGIANFTDIPPSLTGTFPAETSFTGSLNLPFVGSAGFSLDYTLSENHKLTLVYDYNYTGWSSYDTLAFDFANEDTPDSKTTKNWQNTGAHRVGIEYAFKEMFYVRLGGYYDVTPIPDGYVSPELPDADQFVPTVGFGVVIAEKLSLDLAWIHQNTSRESALDEAGFTAKYNRIADVIAFSVAFNF